MVTISDLLGEDDDDAGPSLQDDWDLKGSNSDFNLLSGTESLDNTTMEYDVDEMLAEANTRALSGELSPWLALLF